MPNPVIAGTDGSPEAAKAVAWAADLAAGLDRELLVVHVLDTHPAALAAEYVMIPQERFDEVRANAKEALESDWSNPAREAGVKWRSLLLEGNPAEEVLRLAVQEAATVIVVGRRGRGGFKELLFGSVCHHLVQHSSKPVVVVPLT